MPRIFEDDKYEGLLFNLKSVKVADPVQKALIDVVIAQLIEMPKTTICPKGMGCKDEACSKAHPHFWNPNHSKKSAPKDDANTLATAIQAVKLEPSATPVKKDENAWMKEKDCDPSKCPGKKCGFKHPADWIHAKK